MPRLQILDAVPVRIGVGAFDQAAQPRRHFLMMAGVGLDARIVHELDLELKRRFGKLSYWHGGFRQIGRDKGRVSDCTWMVSSGWRASRFWRGCGITAEILRLRRNIRLNDNDFEIVIFERHGWQDYVRFFGGVVINRLSKTYGVSIVRGDHAVLSPVSDTPVHVQTDGEAIGLLPGTISVRPDALTLLLPKRYAEG